MVTDVRSTLVLIAVTAWQQVIQLGPYVAGGVIVAAMLGPLNVSRWLTWSAVSARRLSRGSPASVVGAACLGGLSPLSTYGTVPMLLQLLRDGASPGPVVAFLVASSMLSPQLFFLVLGGLGARLALAQVTGIVILSVSIGLIAARLPASFFLQSSARSMPPAPPRRLTWSGFLSDVFRLSEWIGLTFVVGVIVSAAIQVLTPTHWITWLLTQNHRWGVLAAGILGVPFYTCGGSAVPILAGLAQMGMQPGVALAFLLSGPATRMTALSAVGSLLNRRALAIYTVYVIIGAVMMGALLAEATR